MGFRSLLAYKKSFELAMEVFEISKGFPKKEIYSLTDQIRISSRTVCINISEDYRKRQYPKHFISKMSDADAENSETLGRLEFALSCGYIAKKTKNEFEIKNKEIGKLLNYMMKNPSKFL